MHDQWHNFFALIQRTWHSVLFPCKINLKVKCWAGSNPVQATKSTRWWMSGSVTPDHFASSHTSQDFGSQFSVPARIAETGSFHFMWKHLWADSKVPVDTALVLLSVHFHILSSSHNFCISWFWQFLRNKKLFLFFKRKIVSLSIICNSYILRLITWERL